MPEEEPLGSSFRDPAGHVFLRDGVLLRRVEPVYLPHYERLMQSGLYARLVERGWLIPHEEEPSDGGPARVLRPERVAFVSYPYEWCFGQLRDAALLTLRVQREALRFGMTLKDASAYNVQFHRGRPVWIDTLSFEEAREGRPWTGYRQFCQHFLAPLALVALRDARLAQLLRVHLDGVPLDLASALLPARAWLRPSLWMHLRLHAAFQRRYASGGTSSAARTPRMSERSLLALVHSLESAVRRLAWEPGRTTWSDYGEGDSYGAAALEHKQAFVREQLARLRPGRVFDLGANTGLFSRIAAEQGALTVAFDGDPACVERAYRRVRQEKETRILPLWIDLANPSPALGWAHRERQSWLERSGADVVLALALIHHLAIANNVPLAHLARFFAGLGERLIVEFVPKEDPKVRTLLAAREDVFPDYSEEGFRSAFAACFDVEQSAPLRDSRRTLYLMRRRVTPG